MRRIVESTPPAWGAAAVGGLWILAIVGLKPPIPAGAAWLLASLAGGLVVLAAWTQSRVSRTLVDLRAARTALSYRATELESLQTIGREIVSSPDPGRVFQLIDQECRKILPSDAFFVALAERNGPGLRAAFRRRGDLPGRLEDRALRRGLATHAAAQKRRVRIDDFSTLPEDSPLRTEIVPEGVRSALAVPLLVGDDVIGVLSIQSLKPRAYDEHHMVIAAAVAQQAAVAVQHARHYQLATFDSLTRFFTRDYFFKRLDDEYSRAARYEGTFGLLMVDLDDFKTVNDRFGHLAGDEYLKAVGETIRSELRDADMTCRFGGDEFCVLLPETDFEGARTIAERVRSAVSALVVGFDDEVLRTTVSIGVVAYPQHDPGDVLSIVKLADQALYAAKGEGRDRVVPYAA